MNWSVPPKKRGRGKAPQKPIADGGHQRRPPLAHGKKAADAKLSSEEEK